MPAMPVRAPLFQSPEISEKRLERRRVELVRRHFCARLDALRVEDPAGQIPDVVGKRPRRDRSTAGEVSQVRPVLAARSGSADGMAHRAGGTEKYAFARLRQRV